MAAKDVEHAFEIKEILLNTKLLNKTQPERTLVKIQLTITLWIISVTTVVLLVIVATSETACLL
jgi:heme/copper-type cytochrome/quinol oxidase subunit 2